jgi:acetyltransferase-like isoleucine patch superfamily enzyme
MNPNETSIFERMLAGGLISFADPEYPKIFEAVSKTFQQSLALNTSTDIAQIRERLSEVIGQTVDESTTVFTPFHTNFGKHISLGKNVFINHACTFLDLGGIVIEDEVLVGPKVSLITENHPVAPEQRKMLDLKRIVLKRNCWIGANSVILSGVTVGVNSVVAAGSVVTKDVPDDTVVAGVPARVIKKVTEG